MEIGYDKDADALHIKFIDAAVARNKKVDDLTIIDLDKNGNLIGIEFLDASKRIPPASLEQVSIKNMIAV